MPLTVLTWNLHGSAGVDVEAVAGHARTTGADVLFLQEVPPSGARAVARLLAARSSAWSFKHWAVRTPPEGLAVIGVTQPVVVRASAITAGWRLWDWRRRIAQRARLVVDGRDVVVVHTHLSPHRDGRPERLREVEVVAPAAVPPDVVVGDLNDDPDSEVLAAFAGRGLRDGWEVATQREGPGETCFTRGPEVPASRRLDYVLCGAGLVVERAAVPDTTGDDRARWAALSDHLPVVVTVGAADGPEA